MFGLTGKTAFVSGAAGLLGSAITAALVGAGATVIANGRDTAKLKALQSKLGVEIAPCDLTDEAECRALFRSIPTLDILVNNAHSGSGFVDTYIVAVVVAHRAVEASLPALQRAVRVNGDASVINIASMYGMVSPDPEVYGDSGMNNPPHYGPAKAGLIQLTRYMACHLAPVRFNAISPGPFPPDGVDAAFKKRLAKKVPLERLGKPDEVGGAVTFLASNSASYITGANLPIDGGWTAW